LRRFRIPEIVLGFLIATALWSVVLWLVTDPQTYHQICEPDQYGHERCTPHSALYIGFVYLTYVINAATLTLAATVAIAYFTGTLKRSTDRLWEAGERQIMTSRQIGRIQAIQMRTQIKLARETADRQAGQIQSQIEIAKESADAAKIAAESAKAAVLPSIGIHEIELCEPTADNPSVHIRYSVTNYGGGVAIVNDIRSQIMLQVWRDGKMVRISDGATATWNSVLPINNPSGFHIIAMRMLTLKDLADLRDGSSSLRVYLDMIYRDTFKARGDAQFSFTYDIRVGGFRLTPRQQQSNTEGAD